MEWAASVGLRISPVVIQEAIVRRKHLAILGREVIGPQILAAIVTPSLRHDICALLEVEDRKRA
jgi:hypothetical protein